MYNYQNHLAYESYNLAYPINESFSLHKDSIFSEDEWKELAIWYLNLEQETITELEIALDNEDFHRLITLGDQIYGHGGSFGFHSISLFGKNIELAATSKHSTLLSYLITSFKSYTKHLLLEIGGSSVSSNFDSSLTYSAASC